MKLKNIKVRFIFKKDVIKKINRQIIWKNEGVTFTIYKDASEFINVTGMKNLHEIKQQKKSLEECLNKK